MDLMRPFILILLSRFSSGLDWICLHFFPKEKSRRNCKKSAIQRRKPVQLNCCRGRGTGFLADARPPQAPGDAALEQEDEQAKKRQKRIMPGQKFRLNPMNLEENGVKLGSP